VVCGSRRLCVAFERIRDNLQSGHANPCPADTDRGSQDQSPPEDIAIVAGLFIIRNIAGAEPPSRTFRLWLSSELTLRVLVN
jgi:hypothetical protein